jgi:hypothetical protein
MNTSLNKGPSPMRSGLFLFGVAATVVWLATGIYLMVVRGDHSNLPKPNEWGDIFAGLAAPVAFLWLVLGFLQQGRELQLSTKALELQVTELKNSVEQQQELVKVTREQLAANVAEIERTRQDEIRAAAPFFSLSTTGYSSGSDGIRHDLVLVNTGATATELNFQYVPPLSHVPWADLPMLGKGETAKSVLFFPGGQGPNEFKLHIIFRNAMGQQQRKIFACFLSPGRATFTEEPGTPSCAN